MGVQEKAVLFAASAKLHEVSSHPCLEVKEAKQGSRYMSKREQAKNGQKPRVRKHVRIQVESKVWKQPGQEAHVCAPIPCESLAVEISPCTLGRTYCYKPQLILAFHPTTNAPRLTPHSAET